jgi:DNA (cytosine-5)-methyltransferase 1
VINVLDLFSGIGGFSLGLERTGGFRTVAFCEVLPKPRHLLNHYWPDVPCYDDVNTLTAERLAADGISVDALCGGFPCQDLSYAGKGAGLDGARSGLWFQIARLLRELRDIGRPVRLVYLENVSALLGRGLGVVLGDLAALGYDAEWDCIPASAVGAPHRRDRIWIVAYPRGEQHEGFGDAFRRALAQELSEAALANAAGEWRDGSGLGSEPSGGREPANGGSHVADALVQGLEGRSQPGEPDRPGQEPGQHPAGRRGATWGWATEPDVGRVANGVPARVDRLHGLGNAVVPEIPYRLGRASLSALATLERLAA